MEANLDSPAEQHDQERLVEAVVPATAALVRATHRLRTVTPEVRLS